MARLFDDREISELEEAIQDKQRLIPEEKRRDYYKRYEEKYKDPDAYAALNFFFVAGLHHMYLGKWLRGCMNLTVFLSGLVLIVFGFYDPRESDGIVFVISGVSLIVLISVIELWALFRSQSIVRRHNARIAEELLQEFIR